MNNARITITFANTDDLTLDIRSWSGASIAELKTMFASKIVGVKLEVEISTPTTETIVGKL